MAQTLPSNHLAQCERSFVGWCTRHAAGAPAAAQHAHPSFIEFLLPLLLEKNICRDDYVAHYITDNLETGALGFKFFIVEGAWGSRKVVFEFCLPKAGLGAVAKKLGDAGLVQKLHNMPRHPATEHAGAYVIRRGNAAGLGAVCTERGGHTVITTVSAPHPFYLRERGRWRTGRVGV